MKAVLSSLLSMLRSCFQTRTSMQIEILALRHQLAVLQRRTDKSPKLRTGERLLWFILSRVWEQWRSALVVVKPETVIAWHRKGFRLYWRWKSRAGKCGKPCVSRETRELIRQMSKANPLWGAPRIHGELLKLGIQVSQATVAKYMARQVGAPSPTERPSHPHTANRRFATSLPTPGSLTTPTTACHRLLGGWCRTVCKSLH